MAIKTLPDQITDLFIALIFTESLKPGDKLPPERQLAEYLHVDRTSLRMALRTLGRMNVVKAVQGSGIRVLDYRTQGGLDFLDNLYHIPELELGADFYLSGLDLFTSTMPLVIRMATERQTKQQQLKVSEMLKGMYSALEKGASAEELAKLEIKIIDEVQAQTGNVFLMSAATSSRRIRLSITEILFSLVDIKTHLDNQVSLMVRYLQGELDLDALVNEYHRYIAQLSAPLRGYFQAKPAKPRLTASPLKNEQVIMSLDLACDQA